MSRGVVAALIAGVALLGGGIFFIGDRSGQITRVAYVAGIALLSLAVVSIIRSGWRGSRAAWVVAAPAAAILTWTFYELARQDVPLPQIGFLGEMTAPTLSAVVAIGLLILGWARTSRLRDQQRRLRP